MWATEVRFTRAIVGPFQKSSRSTLLKVGESGLSHKGDGTRFEDYYAYGTDVLAATDGRVIKTANDQSQGPSAMQRPDETQEAYSARLQKEQASRLAKGLTAITGNHVMVR